MYYHMEAFKKVDVIVTPTTGLSHAIYNSKKPSWTPSYFCPSKALPWQHQIHQCPSQQGWQCTPLTLVCLLCNGSNIQWPEVVYAFGVLLLELLMGKCPSLTDNVGGGTIMDLPSWVQLVVGEEWMAEVFDPQMVEMPQIAMVCTLVVSDQWLRTGQVAKMIEEVCGGGGELSP